MSPCVSPFLRLALAFGVLTLGAAPVKVCLVSDDPAALKSLADELHAAGAVVTEVEIGRAHV